MKDIRFFLDVLKEMPKLRQDPAKNPNFYVSYFILKSYLARFSC